MKPRDYQEAAIAEAGQALRRVRSALCVLPTGVGKGALIGMITKRAIDRGRRVLIFVHRKEIVDQLAQHVRTWADHDPAIEQAARREATEDSRVVVGSIQSLIPRLDRFAPDRFDLIIYDECFPAGTLVDGRPIESIGVGDTVMCVSQTTGELRRRPVTRTFRSSPRTIVVLHLRHGRRIVTTPSHPIYVPGRGFVIAQDLAQEAPGVPVLRLGVPLDRAQEVLLQRVPTGGGARAAEGGAATLHQLRRDRRAQGAPLVSGQVGASLLLGQVPRGGASPDPSSHDGGHESEARERPHEGKQSHAPSREPEEDVGHASPDRARTENSWWKRARAYCRRAGNVGRHRLADPSDCPDASTSKAGWLSDALQNRRRERRAEDCDRSRRTKPQRSGAQGPGSQEGRVFALDWVDRVSFHEPGSDGRFGGLCPDGAVYNLEVEEHHNYFAEGVLVHNCHHAVASQPVALLGHFAKAKVLGFTATPNRGDEKALGQVFDEVAYDMQLRDAIDLGWLTPIKVRSIRCPSLDLGKVRKRQGELAAGDLGSVMSEVSVLREAIVPAVQIAGEMQAIVFCVTIAHMHCVAATVREVARDLGVDLPLATVDGKTPKAERPGIMQDFREGKIRWLLNVGVATEGFDAPATEAVIFLRPTLSRGLFCLDLKTEVLTRRGWLTYDDVRPDDLIAQYDIQDGSIRWSLPTGYVCRPRDGDEEMYSLSTGAIDIRITAGHRCIARWKRGRKRMRGPETFLEAAELSTMRSDYEIPVAGMQPSGGVPLSRSELRFIGIVMSDGTINSKTGGITITQATHQPWCDDIERTLVECNFRFTRKETVRTTRFAENAAQTVWTISRGNPRKLEDRDKRGWGDLSPFLDKELADGLEDVTPEQLNDLLYGLNLGDGRKQPKHGRWVRRTMEISTGRKRLADRLQSLCVRRGFRCNVAVGDWNDRPIYLVRIKRERFRSVGGSSRRDRPSLTREPWRSENVWCIEVPSGAFVARRNGKVFVTGNCQMGGRGTRPLPGVVDGPPTADARKAAIASSAKPHCLWLDFTGNSDRHDLASPMDLLGGDYSLPDQRTAERLLADGTTDDLMAALEMARQQRRSKDRERLARLGDPFALFDLDDAPDRFGRPMTDKQRAVLDRLKMPRSMDRRQASAVATELARRQDEGLALYSQVALLAALRHPTEALASMSRHQASLVVRELSRRHWFVEGGWQAVYDRAGVVWPGSEHDPRR